MSKIVRFDKSEINREYSLVVLDKSITRWQDLRTYYQSQLEAYDPGSAGNVLEYMYENGGDYPPTEPWNEYWLSDGILKAMWNYFKKTSDNNDIFKYIRYLGVSIHEFSNVFNLNSRDTSICYKWLEAASRKRVPKDVKKKLSKLLSEFKFRGKKRYYFNDDGYAVMHPWFNDLLITEDGSIVARRAGAVVCKVL